MLDDTHVSSHFLPLLLTLVKSFKSLSLEQIMQIFMVKHIQALSSLRSLMPQPLSFQAEEDEAADDESQKIIVFCRDPYYHEQI